MPPVEQLDRLIGLEDVMRILGKKSRNTIFAMVLDGQLPNPRRSGRFLVWPLSEITKYIGSLPVVDITNTRKGL